MTKNHSFKIVVAGEDFAAVMQAQNLSSRLAAEFEPAVKVSNDAWKFETLDELPSGKKAARGAAEADMVIIAASGSFELPAHVKNWIEGWLPRKRKRAAALVALCCHEDGPPRQSSPLCAYLRRKAGQWGLGFLTNARKSRQKHLKSTTEAPHHPQEILQTKMRESLSPDYAWNDCALNVSGREESACNTKTKREQP